MRQDLNPLEEAQAYRRLVDEFGLSQSELSTRVGRSRSAVANALRLLNLSDELRASLARDEISEGHARAILSLPEEGQRRQAWERVVQKGLSVRQTEELVRDLVAGREEAAATAGGRERRAGGAGGAVAGGAGNARQPGEGTSRRPDHDPLLQRRGAGRPAGAPGRRRGIGEAA